MPALVTLLVPTRGRCSSLQRLLADLDRFGYFKRSDVEVVVIENVADADPHIRQVVERYGARYANQGRPGQAAALNLGIELARGELVAFTDDDVRIVDSDWLDRLASHFSDSSIGYAAGNVLAAEVRTCAQQMWERKGGLSKGPSVRRFGQELFRTPRLAGVPLRLIACGANSMIRRRILEKVGGYDERFGVGAPVGHAQSHEICYKVLRAGYDALYDPRAIVLHHHPETLRELRRRLFQYGIGDTAVHFHFFLHYGDVWGLVEALGGRHVYLLRNLVRRALNRYPMPASMILAGLAGATMGPLVYAKVSVGPYFRRRLRTIGRKQEMAHLSAHPSAGAGKNRGERV